MVLTSTHGFQYDHCCNESFHDHDIVSRMHSSLSKAEAPFILADTNEIQKRVQFWKTFCPNYSFMFKLNGFISNELNNYLSSCIDGFDVVNKQEIKALSSSGLRKIFSNPFLFKKDLTACISSGLDLVIVETREDIEKYANQIILAGKETSQFSILLQLQSMSSQSNLDSILADILPHAIELGFKLAGVSIKFESNPSFRCDAANQLSTCFEHAKSQIEQLVPDFIQRVENPFLVHVNVDSFFGVCKSAENLAFVLNWFASILEQTLPICPQFLASDHEFIMNSALVVATKVNSIDLLANDCINIHLHGDINADRPHFDEDIQILPSSSLIKAFFEPKSMSWFPLGQTSYPSRFGKLMINGLFGAAGEEHFCLKDISLEDVANLRDKWIFWRLDAEQVNLKWRNGLDKCLHFNWARGLSWPSFSQFVDNHNN